MVDDLDGERPTGDFDDRGVVEERREAVGFEGCGADDHAQVGATRKKLSEIAQEEVDVETALVGLVDDDGVVATQIRVALQLGEQDAVGCEFHVGVSRRLVLETNLVPDFAPEFDAELGGDAGCDAASGDTAGLGAGDSAPEAAAHGEANLR